MNPVTQQDVMAHQAVVPWPLLVQVEQDLLLCLAMVAIFSHSPIAQQVAMRGGTVLHKIHLEPASRYSEDIDLVVINPQVSEEDIKTGIEDALQGVFGKAQQHFWENLKLAVRNVARPSRVLRFIYDIPSVMQPTHKLRVEVEVNVTERVPFLPVVRLPFSVPFQDDHWRADIASFDIHEMLGTKMRALFQRSKGRDLFDLYWAFNEGKQTISVSQVIRCFQHYMAQEQTKVGRNEFTEHLASNLANQNFCSDMKPLLLSGLVYDVTKAGLFVKDVLLVELEE
jgi:predicted nucleotidyltransferase component of viral defense system